MGKFRSKLKGQAKGKRWQKGQSSSSNPKTQKYRDMAKSRFFQENLGSTGLTENALSKHNAIITYGHKLQQSKIAKSEAENPLTLAKSLEDMSVRSADEVSESGFTATTKSKTNKTFASDFSKCSNVSYSKLLNRYDPSNPAHKDMLAVLAAVTEAIKVYGGKESSTAYFVVLMESLKASKTQENLIATLTLLAMGIKTVPVPILRKLFSDSATILTDILNKNADSENKSLLRSSIGCLCIILRSVAYSTWHESSTMKVFDTVLAFSLHANSKVRRSAQYGIVAILKKSCFMLPENLVEQQAPPKVHPAAHKVAEYCLSQVNAEALLSGHKSVLHTLNMIKELLPLLPTKDIKALCESMLSLMTHNNIYIRTNCYHAFHDMFAAREQNNLTATLAVQVTRALVAARPASTDHGQILAWTAVLEKACCFLATADLNLCMLNVPTFVNICVTELWLSDNQDINNAATVALKAILQDCVKLAIDAENFVEYKNNVEAVFKSIGSGLDNPFNQAIKHVILTIANCFEIANEKVSYVLGPILKKLIERHESNNFNNDKEVEHATGKAVKSLGPEFVLKIIPLRTDDGINLDRSWLLPVLKEKITNSTLKFFATDILEMATFCRKKSRELTALKDVPGSHTYELLCNQLWSLWPSFCNYPSDVKDNFKAVARVLGSVLKDNPEFRLSIMQGLRKLVQGSVQCSEKDDVAELGRFAKNFIPILLNLYMTPAKGSSAAGQRLAALETIQVYLSISDQSLCEDLFKSAFEQMQSPVTNHFQRESILDVVRVLLVYQSREKIAEVFEYLTKYLESLSAELRTVPKKDKRNVETMDQDKTGMSRKEKARLFEMEFKKAYRALEEVFESDKDGCNEYVKNDLKKIKKILTASFDKVSDSSKAARLRCMHHLISHTSYLSSDSKLLQQSLAEAVISTKGINSKCRQAAFCLIHTIGTRLKNQEGDLKSYLAMLLPGLSVENPRIVSATLRALASVLYNFSEDLGLETLQSLLEKATELTVTSNREVVSGALSFLKVYTKVIPNEVLAGSMPLIMKTLSSMQPDCKRHSRTEIKYFLTRLARKFGADTIQDLVPEDDVMLKQLRNIRKGLNRKKRKDQEKDQSQDDSDKDSVKGTSETIDDILNDSDSDLDFMVEDEDPRPKAKKARGKNQTWIQDDPENIVDLADVSAARKITATDPNQKKKSMEVKAKKKDGGFKTAADGRLIIGVDDSDDDDDDEVKPSGDVDTDTDDTDNEAVEKKPSKLLKTGTKRRYDDLLSIKSGKSNKSRASTATQYKAGGKGIHRPVGSAASVASTFASEYKSKKGRGDVKKKGKPDPYAYIPLSRKNLNKRNKVINRKQFKGIVKAKNRNAKTKSKKRK